MVSWQNGVADASGCFRSLWCFALTPHRSLPGTTCSPFRPGACPTSWPASMPTSTTNASSPRGGPIRRAAGPPLGPGRDPAAPAVPQAPLPARLREPVPRGRRLDLLAPVLPHPADHSVPHPTTLVKLVGRSGPQAVDQLNAGAAGQAVPRTSCCGAASCVSTPPWWRPTSTTPPTPTCWSTRSASWVGWSAGSGAGAATHTRYRDRSRSAGRRLKQISKTLRRRTGQAPGRLTGSPPRSP